MSQGTQNPQPTSRLGASLAVALFGGLTLVTIVWFVLTFSPRVKLPRITPDTGVDYSQVRTALSADNVSSRLESILSNGSRFLGSDGHRQTEQQIRKFLIDADLDVLEQTVSTAAPKTLDRRILSQAGAPLGNVEIYPLFPNQFQPQNTPEEGLTGKLTLVTKELLEKSKNFDGCIALIDETQAPTAFALNWPKYASVGFKGLIIANPKGLDAMNWQNISLQADGSQVNFVRLIATPEILKHAGETVTLHVRTQWENVPTTTLVGILHGQQTNSDAVFVQASYDAPSVLPDLAPGVLSAVPVASVMQTLQGLLPYKNVLKRDVVFVFTGGQMMANLSTDRLAAALGPNVDRVGTHLRLQQELADANTSLASAKLTRAFFDDPKFFEDAATTMSKIASLGSVERTYFDDEVRYVMNSVVLDRSEEIVAPRVRFITSDNPNDINTPLGQVFAKAKSRYDDAQSAAGYPIDKLLNERELLNEAKIRDRAVARFSELETFYTEEVRRAGQNLKLNEALAGRYKTLIMVSPEFLPVDSSVVKGEGVSFTMGDGIEPWAYVQYPVMNNVLVSTARLADASMPVTYESLQTSKHSNWAASKLGGKPLLAYYWGALSYPSFALINTDRAASYQCVGYPIAQPFMRDIKTMSGSLRFLGDSTLSLALGAGTFPDGTKVLRGTVSGRVYVANVGQSIVPNFPQASGLFGIPWPTVQGLPTAPMPGFVTGLLQFTDPTGRYYLPQTSCAMTSDPTLPYSPIAVGFGKDGNIRWVKDEGSSGQAIYKSSNLSWSATSNVNIVIFRASPVTVLDLVNPQTLKSYTGVDFISREGLASLDRRLTIPLPDLITTFVEPDWFFYLQLKAGSPTNDKAQDTRAFVLGTGEGKYTPDPQKEIDGPGFVAYDSPFLLDMPLRIARSMQFVNAQRLALQNRHGMADARTNEFHTKSAELLEKAQDGNTAYLDRTLEARDAVTYAELNHPVLRESVTEAVIGILYYLALLVPFVFFFEKLAFGFPDIRKQLLAQAVVFLIVFALLRVLHPAFEMLRSSVMVLLGFVILLISAGITILSAGKFSENLEGLRKKRGKVSAAESNTAGVVGTAFMLGLNNMHRRRVRTGLTCATLVLITFAMICFTSIQSDLVDTTTAIGKAPYQGFVVKPDQFAPVSAGEVFALQTRYATKFHVTPRAMYVGEQTWERQQINPEISLAYANSPLAKLKSGLVLSPDEPLRDKIKLLAGDKWFDLDKTYGTTDTLPIFISDATAKFVGITVNTLKQETVVTINGRRCVVRGIFDSETLNTLRDVDGRAVLPFDIEGIVNLRVAKGQPLAEDDDPLINAADVFIAPQELGAAILHSTLRTVSVAVELRGVESGKNLDYKDARGIIDTFLEQSQRATYYGLDGVAYLGKRARESSFGGMLELIIPLIIAALTVLNTMRGSVYERRDEIFVYNAVGIAPRFIFFMFFAEAFVYAVVGSVLGYILSQGTGRILTELGMTGGLNMTFTSISTILASFAITIAVFVSTLFPALSAKNIAAPANESGWTVPPTENDTMTFPLPFTFDRADRVAVLAFFRRYFLDHGEGSAGRFRAGDPTIGVMNPDGAASDPFVPQLTVTVWLKPFDLGVSQDVTISLPIDQETGEYIAMVSITRRSGTRDSWMRLQKGFLMRVRKHFLHWRAVPVKDRVDMFDEARGLLESALSPAGEVARV